MKLNNDAAMVETLPEDEHEIPPTAMENPPAARPLEFITERFSLPNAREIDPTLFYFITLPLLYGAIVGDVLYGIASYAIATWMMEKFRNSEVMHNVGNIWRISAIPSVFFGILFDEWGGMSHWELIKTLNAWGLPLAIGSPLYTPWIHRVEEMTALIALSLSMGLLHIALGFILGAINHWHHSRKHAIAKIAWLGVEIGGFFAIGGYLLGMFAPAVALDGGVLLALGIAVLAWAEGVPGIIELPGLMGNILSYIRIAAIGVTGVLLANIINKTLLPLPGQGWAALLFFPIFLLLHIVNIIVAMFEALIQGGRLNIIEFRLKFLSGGGKPFEPFAYSY